MNAFLSPLQGVYIYEIAKTYGFTQAIHIEITTKRKTQSLHVQDGINSLAGCTCTCINDEADHAHVYVYITGRAGASPPMGVLIACCTCWVYI